MPQTTLKAQAFSPLVNPLTPVLPVTTHAKKHLYFPVSPVTAQKSSKWQQLPF